MDMNHSTGNNRMPSQEHVNFIAKLNDAKIPRQSQLIANRLFMKNFPRETTGAEIENCFQSFGPVHDVKIIAKENTHFAFISFVNESTALDVLRQHAHAALTFQNRPIILAPAYKKSGLPPSSSPSSFYPEGGSTMTPPPTPLRTNNIMSQAPQTPFQQHQQQQMSAPHALYPPIFFPVQTNMPFLPMTGTYLYPQAPPSHHPQLPPSFYPTFYTQGQSINGAAHQQQLINGHAYLPSPYMYSMGPPPAPHHALQQQQYQQTTLTNGDACMTNEY